MKIYIQKLGNLQHKLSFEVIMHILLFHVRISLLSHFRRSSYIHPLQPVELGLAEFLEFDLQTDLGQHYSH